MNLSPDRIFALDCAAEVARIGARLREALAGPLSRRGAVVAISGGVDSAVCAGLCARALGPERVFGLLLPERESSPRSQRLGQQVAEGLGIPYLTVDITATLSALGCYEARDAAIRQVFPAYGPGWRSKLVISGGLSGGLNYFKLVVRDEAGVTHERRVPHRQYLEIVAAQNFKQRVRKTLEYYHADRLHHAVIGTPNRLEYDQGFFVKNGDGAADIKPIAHLYKTQVYALSRHLGLPEEVCTSSPTTDTYSLPQGQDEFYFALPYAQMDLALWAYNHGVPAAELAAALGCDEALAARVYHDIQAKRETTRPLHARPLLIDPVPEAA
jgi:NAD+ synthase